MNLLRKCPCCFKKNKTQLKIVAFFFSVKYNIIVVGVNYFGSEGKAYKEVKVKA